MNRNLTTIITVLLSISLFAEDMPLPFVHYSFETNTLSQDTLRDEANNVNAILGGGGALVSDSIRGSVMKSLNDGTNMSYAYPIDGALLNDAEEFTIAFWVKLNRSITWSSLFSTGDKDLRANHIYCSPNYWNKRGLTTVGLYGGSSMESMTKQWINITITMDNTGLYSWYENGELLQQKLYPNKNIFGYFDVDMFTLGALRRGSDATSYSTDGYFDDFKIYKTALTQKQVKISAGIELMQVDAPYIEYQFNSESLVVDAKGNADCQPNYLATSAVDAERGDVLFLDNDATMAAYAAIDPSVLQDTFTVSFWAKSLDRRNWEGLFGYSNNASKGIYLSPGISGKYGLVGTGGGWVKLSTDSVIEADKWYYYAVTQQGSSCSIFLNGNEIASGDIKTSISGVSPANFAIGMDTLRSKTVAYSFNGYIDDFKYYTYSLSPQEIAYTGGFPWDEDNETSSTHADSINGILNKVEVYKDAKSWFPLETTPYDYFERDSLVPGIVSYINYAKKDSVRGAVAKLESHYYGGFEITNFDFSDETYSFSAWVKLESIGQWQGLFTLLNDESNVEDRIYITPAEGHANTVAVIGANNNINKWRAIKGDHALAVGEWKHLAMTFNHGYIKFFIDGELLVEGDLDLTMEELGANRAFIGADPTLLKRGLDMEIDDIALFDYELQASHVANIYAGRTTERPIGYGKYIFEPENYAKGVWKIVNDADTSYVSFDENSDDVLKFGTVAASGVVNIWARVKADADVIAPCLINYTNSAGEVSESFESNNISATDAWEWVELYQSGIVSTDNYVFAIYPNTSGCQFDKIIVTADWGFDPHVEYDASVDTESPTAPLNLQEAAVDNVSATLVWSESTDNVGVVAYELFNDGELIGLFDQNAGIQPLLASTEYNLTVRARDLAGNVSAPSATLSITTLDALFNIDASKRYKTIDHFGSSDAWAGTYVGRDWSEATKLDLAKLLFSASDDAEGNPEGIGLSMWRVKIGDGSTVSKLADGAWTRETECYMQADGSYDWTKQAGTRWFMDKAHGYGVRFTGWTDSPPYFMTRTGTTNISDGQKKYNLKDDMYDDYANFLAEVAKHFQDEGKPFDVISPINEPQWDWTGNGQSGSYATNAEIAKVVKEMNTAFTTRGVTAKAMISEAGSLSHLFAGSELVSNQIETFWSKSGSNYIGSQEILGNIVAAHSYWSNGTLQTSINNRISLNNKINEVNPNLDYWQTEYSLLGREHIEGRDGEMDEIDYSLYLARLINIDLTLANATGWSFWTTFNTGSSGDHAYRFGLFNVSINEDGTEGSYSISKNLWALGQFSRFIRPGMQRISSDFSGVSDVDENTSQVSSAYVNDSSIAIVLINYSDKDQNVSLNINGVDVDKLRPYRTSATEDMVALDSVDVDVPYFLKAKSIVTLVGKINTQSAVLKPTYTSSDVKIECYPNPASDYVIVESKSNMTGLSIISLSGKVMYQSTINSSKSILPLSRYKAGTYMIMVNTDKGPVTKKINIID